MQLSGSAFGAKGFPGDQPSMSLKGSGLPKGVPTIFIKHLLASCLINEKVTTDTFHNPIFSQINRAPIKTGSRTYLPGINKLAPFNTGFSQWLANYTNNVRLGHAYLHLVEVIFGKSICPMG